ncbi:hypothetical protein [Blastomonas fulva]|jgi:hypothetical protein|uniref:hypothetical protein n=1 Tax=Blastomonas fulva TaxID=1550728 RepID=UPI003D28985E
MTGDGQVRTEILALALTVVAAALFFPWFPLNHDTSWYLLSTNNWLDGASLYRDIMEISPPLVFYHTVPSVLVSRFLGISPEYSFIGYCIVLGALSAAWIIRLLAGSVLAAAQRRTLFAAVLAALFVLPIAEFGQREHLMLMLAMPYLLMLALGDQGPRCTPAERIAIGLVAALGLMLKPYFLLIPAGIVLARLARDRQWQRLFDWPNLAIGAALPGYMGLIALAHPAYLADIVPTGRMVYSAYETNALGLWLRPEIGAALIATWIALRHRAALDPVLTALLGGAAGALACYVIQHKGWDYHVLPLAALLLLVVAWIVPQRRAWRGNDRLLAVLLGAVVLLALGHQIARGPYRNPLTDDLAAFVPESGMRITVMSADFAAAFPMVNQVSGRWVSRYPVPWMVPGAHIRLQRGDCAGQVCRELAEVLDRARGNIVDDLIAYRPERVFIDENRRKLFFGGEPFDYLAFLRQDARFSAAWSCYARIGSRRGYGVWARTCGA